MKGKFSIIDLTETWYNDDRADKILHGQYQITHLFHQIRKTGQKEGVLLYLCTTTLILR